MENQNIRRSIGTTIDGDTLRQNLNPHQSLTINIEGDPEVVLIVKKGKIGGARNEKISEKIDVMTDVPKDVMTDVKTDMRKKNVTGKDDETIPSEIILLLYFFFE